MQPISVLSNGVKLFNDDFWRGWAATIGLVPLHNLPIVETDNEILLNKIDNLGGFGFAVMRTPIDPPFFQKQIDGVTRSPWGHCVMVLGEDVGMEARNRYPDLLLPKPSPRWKASKGHPVPKVEGIRSKSSKYEIVESQAYITVSDLRHAVGRGEQVIFFTNPNWTMDQLINMAVEAYSWVGEPYDVFEIGSWIMSFVPNSKKLKVCSTLVGEIIAAENDSDICGWAYRHGLDMERFAPRDIFAYGSDHKDMQHVCFRCKFEDALNAGIKTN